MKKILAVLKNKPAMAALTTVIVATAAKLGLDVDDEYIGAIIGAGALVIGAFVYADRKRTKNLPTGEVGPDA